MPITNKHKRLLAEALSRKVFRTERDVVLRKLDVPGMEALFKRHGVPLPVYTTPKTPYAIMHKARVMLDTFTETEKVESRTWLLQNGFELPKEDGVSK